MSALRRIAYQLQAKLHFSRAPCISFKKQAGITANLPQLGKLRQYLDLLTGKFLFCLFGEDRQKPLDMRIIKAALFVLQDGHHIFLDFIRQIGEHILFQPS